MHHPDPHNPRDDGDGDLPQLPIPRPGESPAASPTPTDQSPAPRLGGGASFTSVTPRQRGELPAPPSPDSATDEQTLTWQLAAQLTAGMLANPSRGHSSVKDAMGLFDQFLLEVDAYVRIASDIDRSRAEHERRRAHGEYFRQGGADADDGSSERHDATSPLAAGSRQSPTPVPAPQPAPARPTPERPRPPADYRPIPPGMRGPYAPGSMAGTPPTEDPDADQDQVRRSA